MTSGTGSITLVPLGVGDAFSDTWYSSCLYVESGGYGLIIDCPHPIRKIMKEASADSGVEINLEKLNGILLTHLHGDHCSGLEGVGFYAYYVAQTDVSLLAHEDVMADVWTNHLAGTMAPLCDPLDKQRKFTDFFTPSTMREDAPGTLGPFSIQCRKTDHHIPTTAVKLTVGGTTLAYSSDTAWDPSLIEWLSDATLIIHETNVATHTPYEKLAALPAELRTKMRLIHYPDDFDRAGAVIECLEQGKRYNIS